MKTTMSRLAPLMLAIIATVAMAIGGATYIDAAGTGPVNPAQSMYTTGAVTTSSATGVYQEVTGSRMRVERAWSGLVNYRCAATLAGADVKIQGTIDDAVTDAQAAAANWYDLTMLDVAGADQSAARVAISTNADNTFRVSGVGKTAKDAANGTYRTLRAVARRTADGGAFAAVTCQAFAK